jgi:hypothetical protein
MKAWTFQAYCPACGDVCTAEPKLGQLVCAACGTAVVGVLEQPSAMVRASYADGHWFGRTWSRLRRFVSRFI